jgi:hypothetical protein
VTIHGIGFQQPPDGATPGYADGLQKRLQQRLTTQLGGDPLGEFCRQAGQGAIYVHSDWPPATRNMNQGLARLGIWKAGDPSHRTIDASQAPLAQDDRPIAHIALVYSHLEDQGSHLGASLETFAKAVISHGTYASLPSLVATGVSDAWAALTHRQSGTAAPTPSLQVRAQPAAAPQAAHAAPPAPSGAWAVIQQLDRDVSTYVCRNDLRERVRGFAHEAILRLCCRDDVGQVVVNAHSQGTVLAYDVIRQLPPFAAQQVKLLVTAGSPLRKYATMFYWGTDAGCLHQIPWANFWDETDPVADPLAPALSWRRGQPLPPATGQSELYVCIDPDSGNPLPVHLLDHQTQNLDHGAGGGLPSHNYWDNDDQFVQPLAAMLQTVVAGKPVTV